jgi:hypothetical protein
MRLRIFFASEPRASFTLIELLMVIGIVAVLSVVVILVINPAQLLKQARDSTRLSDIDTLMRGVQLYEAQAFSVSPGNASTTYFSLVDPAATSSAGTDCSGVGGVTPPSGWTYHCAASSTLRAIDGTGWLPVNFTSLNSRPFSSLPTDPANTSSSGYYYAYTPGGSFALTTAMESDKYLTTRAKEDGGYDLGRFEAGSDLALVARSEGLVGWWKLDEVSGTRTDSAGTNHLTDNNTVTQAAGKIGNAAQFTLGNTEYLSIADNTALSTGDISFTMCAWVYIDVKAAGSQPIVAKWGPAGSNTDLEYRMNYSGTGGGDRFRFGVSAGPSIVNVDASTFGSPSAVTWHFVCGWHDAASNTINIKVNDGAANSQSHSAGVQDTSYAFAIGRHGEYVPSDYMNGRIDNVLFWKRVLTAKEIENIYNATR